MQSVVRRSYGRSVGRKARQCQGVARPRCEWSQSNGRSHLSAVSDGQAAKLQREAELKVILDGLERQRGPASPALYASLLQRCGKARYVCGGKRVHAFLLNFGLHKDTHLGNLLARMYFTCGSFHLARRIFVQLPHRDLISWTLFISACLQHGHLTEASQLFRLMHMEDIAPDRASFLTILKAFATPAALPEGKLIHAHAIDSGLESDFTLGNAAITMYGKCGCLVGSRCTFNKLKIRDVISWTSMIAAYVQHGQYKGAFKLFREMQLAAVLPNKMTFLAMFNACASLAEAKLIHAQILDSGLESDNVVGNAVISMYGNCNSLEDALRIFHKLHSQDVISWTAIIAVYAQHGHNKYALYLSREMLLEGVLPNKITFTTILNLCDSPIALVEGRLIHACITEWGFAIDVDVGNAIVIMYGKCGDLPAALEMFYMMHERNVASWTAAIAACAQNCYQYKAVQLFRQMLVKGMSPNKNTFVTILSSFTNSTFLPDGKLLHAHIIDIGYESDVMIVTALVMMYGKCGKLENACTAFDKLHEADLACWNAMVATYVQNDSLKEALVLFLQLVLENVMPDNITFITILNGCADIAALPEGRLIHACIMESGLASDLAVGNAIINMYGKCGRLEDACRIFKFMQQHDVVTWTTMTAAYAQNGYRKEAIQFFHEMLLEGVMPNKITFLTILATCNSTMDLQVARIIHSHITKCGYELVRALASAIIIMYGKCGSSKDAYMLFNIMQQFEVASWTAMITAYVQNGHFSDAFQLFQQMESGDIKPNKVTFLTMLNACGVAATLEEGKFVHALAVESGFESDIVMGNAIIDMYGKCGSVEDARKMFDKMHQHDVISWTTIISAYAQHGHSDVAFQLFQQMQLESIEPVSITFLSVLSACSHAGLLSHSSYYLHSMSDNYGVMPAVEHYGCMVDALGRAGKLAEAEDLIRKLPFQPDAITWMTFLSACRIHGDIERGRRAAECVLELDSQNVAAFSLLLNIYIAAGRWNDAANMKKVMLLKGIQ